MNSIQNKNHFTFLTGLGLTLVLTLYYQKDISVLFGFFNAKIREYLLPIISSIQITDRFSGITGFGLAMSLASYYQKDIEFSFRLLKNCINERIQLDDDGWASDDNDEEVDEFVTFMGPNSKAVSDLAKDLDNFKLREKHLKDFKMISGLLKYKLAADKEAEDSLTGALNKYESFKPKDILRQEGEITTVDQILSIGRCIKPNFDALIKDIVDGTSSEVHAPDIKSKPRCVTKCAKEYDGDVCRLCDIVRTSVICTAEEGLSTVIKRFLSNPNINVIRMKNRFVSPRFTGVRDVLLNVVVENFICEIQLHIEFFYRQKNESHALYAFFREYFIGNVKSYEKMINLFTAVGHSLSVDVEESLRAIIQGHDYQLLKSLKKITSVGIMQVPELNILVAKKLFILYQEKGDEKNALTELFSIGNSLYHEGEYDSALHYYNSTLNHQEQYYETNHSKVFVTMNAIGLVYLHQKNYDKALEMFESCLEGKEKTFGEDHEETLKTINNIGLVYRAKGDYDNAILYKNRTLTGTNKKIQCDMQMLTLTTKKNLAIAYRSKESYETVLSLCKKALKSNES